MALDTTQQIFILSRGRAGNGVSAVVTVDVVKQETITLSSQLTDHPVEQGSNMTDHSRPEPITIQAECFVSETPISSADYVRATGGATALTAASGTAKIRQVDGYARRVYNQLKTLRDQGAQLVVITTMGRFDSMVIQTLTFPRNAQNYNALEFSVSFKEIRIVQNKLTRIKISKDTRAGSKSKKGNATQSKPPEELQSALDKNYESGGILSSLGGK